MLPQYSATPQLRQQSHSQFIRAVPKLMSDIVIAAPQLSASSSGDGEQAPTLQGTPAALVAPVSSTTTSDTAQGSVSDPGMGSFTSVPTTSNAPPAVSSSPSTATSGSESANTTSGGAGVSLLLPAATTGSGRWWERSHPARHIHVADGFHGAVQAF
ncbi:hypothetical protein PR002_g355 [Phytophthora rubi]|uniref:Uncharacterized protein n=1 Tax=Phytophthora rubi TaxID=129364 RepID=A0A6A3NZR0_9STRA|nr:hypothetical protein PR002_g355 [Phytophthora rubi]